MEWPGCEAVQVCSWLSASRGRVTGAWVEDMEWTGWELVLADSSGSASWPWPVMTGCFVSIAGMRTE